MKKILFLFLVHNLGAMDVDKREAASTASEPEISSSSSSSDASTLKELTKQLIRSNEDSVAAIVAM